MDHNPDINPFVNLSSESDKEVEDEDRNRNRSPMRSTAPHSEIFQERSGGPSSPQDFTAPDRRGVKRKQTPAKEQSALMTSMAKSCAEMVKATKHDMEIREREIRLHEQQENSLAAAISASSIAAIEQLARLNETILKKIGTSSQSPK